MRSGLLWLICVEYPTPITFSPASHRKYQLVSRASTG